MGRNVIQARLAFQENLMAETYGSPKRLMKNDIFQNGFLNFHQEMRILLPLTLVGQKYFKSEKAQDQFLVLSTRYHQFR